MSEDQKVRRNALLYNEIESQIIKFYDFLFANG